MTILPHLSNIKVNHSQLLRESENNLTQLLSNHLRLVAVKSQTKALDLRQRMNALTQNVSTNELLTHERFLSATEANIQSDNHRRRRESARKLNEILGRPNRNITDPLIPTVDIYNRRLFNPPNATSPARPVTQPPRVASPRTAPPERQTTAAKTVSFAPTPAPTHTVEQPTLESDHPLFLRHLLCHHLYPGFR